MCEYESFPETSSQLGYCLGALRELPWSNIWLSDNPVEVFNEHLSLLVGRYVPTNVIRVRNKDKPWFDDQCRHAFGLKQEANHFDSFSPGRLLIYRSLGIHLLVLPPLRLGRVRRGVSC